MSEYVQEHRRRLTERGFKRVELSVSASDADYLHRIAKALVVDDEQAKRLRKVIDGTVPKKVSVKFKDWVASE
jgi:hypothetical protein